MELRQSGQCKILEWFHFCRNHLRNGGVSRQQEDLDMQQDTAQDENSTARQLRPVVITVIAAKLAVFALLMTTINFQPPLQSPIEVAAAR
jgi:hypothetical protein